MGIYTNDLNFISILNNILIKNDIYYLFYICKMHILVYCYCLKKYRLLYYIFAIKFTKGKKLIEKKK